MKAVGKLFGKYKQSYGDQIIRTIIKSKFAKSHINTIVIMLTTILVRNILCLITCVAIQTGTLYIDFFLHSLITILFLFSSAFIYDGLMGKKEWFYEHTKYYINNYTPQNYRKWKRNIFIILALGGIVITYVVDITSGEIRYYILQSVLVYFIMDQIENNKISNYLRELQDAPKKITNNKLVIKDGFMQQLQYKKNKHQIYLNKMKNKTLNNEPQNPNQNPNPNQNYKSENIFTRKYTVDGLNKSVCINESNHELNDLSKSEIIHENFDHISEIDSDIETDTEIMSVPNDIFPEIIFQENENSDFK
jgi:hypothetical protein